MPAKSKKALKPSKKAAPAKKAKPAPAPKKIVAKANVKATAKAPIKATAKVESKAEKSKGPKLTPAEMKAATRKELAAAAMKAAMQSTEDDSSAEEEEFDPAAFFAASGGKGEFRAHIMRKERVEAGVTVRYRLVDSPLVSNAEMLNLSKGGMCLVTASKLKAGATLRVEIPLPHTSELFAIQAEVVWSQPVGEETNADGKPIIRTGLKFLPMSLAKTAVISSFIQQRRDQVIMAKIGLHNFTDSAPVAGLD